MKSVPKKPTPKKAVPKKPSSKKVAASTKKPKFLGDDVSESERRSGERADRAREKMLNQYMTDMANTPPSQRDKPSSSNQRAPIARSGPVSSGRGTLYSRLTGGLANRGK